MPIGKPMTKIILASKSPRRAQILTDQKITFEIDPADIQEIVDPSWTPEECAVNLSYQKAKVIWERKKSENNSIVLAADTVVALNQEIFGKPKNEQEAHRMLDLLSHHRHRVITGICLWPLNCPQPIKKYETTFVEMVPMSSEDIKAYIQTGSCFDKAGGYGIQDFEDKRIHKIDGDFDNVVGLPTKLLLAELRKLQTSKE